ncbi:hypothetical protein [Parapedobacter tibetensis]|uniref:hypothetical protein n=1 Tax=Parapedobacter tibetensis TaxID=2972951 RepID=UPI00214DE2CF|nr:hypothetical protein [Parapedobacter tibetensis]
MLKGTIAENDADIWVSGNMDDMEGLRRSLEKISKFLHESGFANQASFGVIADMEEQLNQWFRRVHGKPSTRCTVKVDLFELLALYGLMSSLFDYLVTDEIDEINKLLLVLILKNVSNQLPLGDRTTIQQFICKRFEFPDLRHFMMNSGYLPDAKLGARPKNSITTVAW